MAITKLATNENDSIIEDKEMFPKLSAGPLDYYRKKASFDYRKLAVIITGEELLKYHKKVYQYIENEPIFQHTPCKTIDELKHLSTLRAANFVSKKIIALSENSTIQDNVIVFAEPAMCYDANVSVKFHLSTRMFPDVLRTIGNDSMCEVADAAENGQAVGAFALTEFAHGSNTLGMRTTAHYDTFTKEFIINTPDFEAAKCWVGNLGKTCTHAIVYAQLHTPDGQHHGLNAFLVPIRNKKSFIPFAGITVGDMGEKIGLNGVDNGFVMFNHYRIPKKNLLSRLGYITDDGQYISHIGNSKKRLGALFGSLSRGRVYICYASNTIYLMAVTIATRYSACRKQFYNSECNDELPVLEYQSQLYRLLPHLATVIAQKIFSTWQILTFYEFSQKIFSGDRNAGVIGMEIHALSSSTKPICTWSSQAGIQDCREATGGHGYLKASRLGDLRDDNDPNCTYEGENNVLIQQTSNWLLSVRSNGFKAFEKVSPLKTAQFLVNGEHILTEKSDVHSAKEAIKPQKILKAFNWLLTYLLENSYARSESLKSSGLNESEIRNENQVFYAQNLSFVYAQRMIFQTFYEMVENLPVSPERMILSKLLSLYGLNILSRNLATFYEGGYISNSKQSEAIKFGILELLRELKDESVSIIDAIAPPDFVVNSPLGMSDGEIYKRIQSVLWQTPGTFERAKWWQDIISHNSESNNNQLNSKL